MDGKITMDIYHRYRLKVLPYLHSENMHKISNPIYCKWRYWNCRIKWCEDSENDDEDVSTDVSDNDDSDWELCLEHNSYYHITNMIIEIINDKILLIINNVD